MPTELPIDNATWRRLVAIAPFASKQRAQISSIRLFTARKGLVTLQATDMYVFAQETLGLSVDEQFDLTVPAALIRSARSIFGITASGTLTWDGDEVVYQNRSTGTGVLTVGGNVLDWGVNHTDMTKLLKRPPHPSPIEFTIGLDHYSRFSKWFQEPPTMLNTRPKGSTPTIWLGTPTQIGVIATVTKR